MKKVVMSIQKILIKKTKSIFHKLGIELSKYESENNRARRQQFNKWETLAEILMIHLNRQHQNLTIPKENNFIKFISDNYRRSKSQIFQDLLVLFLLG